MGEFGLDKGQSTGEDLKLSSNQEKDRVPQWWPSKPVQVVLSFVLAIAAFFAGALFDVWKDLASKAASLALEVTQLQSQEEIQKQKIADQLAEIDSLKRENSSLETTIDELHARHVLLDFPRAGI